MIMPTSLRQASYHPLYDTFFTVTPGQLRLTLFQNHTSFPNGMPKTERDTNLRMYGQLGHPLAAHWAWMRLHFPAKNEHKVQEFLDRAVIRLVVGSTIVAGPLTSSSFLPIIIMGDIDTGDESADLVLREYVKQRLAQGHVDIPPLGRWLHTPIGPLDIGPTDGFQVDIDFPNEPAPTDLRVKVLLGPTLYRPI